MLSRIHASNLAAATARRDLGVSAKSNWHYDYIHYFGNQNKPKLLRVVQLSILSRLRKAASSVRHCTDATQLHASLRQLKHFATRLTVSRTLALAKVEGSGATNAQSLEGTRAQNCSVIGYKLTFLVIISSSSTHRTARNW